ncbi:TIGR03032 family protein [Flammeovirga pacifica]|uniref:TIGR03032 family protein n=1 Tax=Flammeovirga pacifica TaxID=915059 RepID=A0A1S1Z1F9_FLAPC|nr:TIGR03032 family protein [Flammeovirga pacifica]OHX66945.1 TIGR03032 family protein [Flammeovirga pacifica]
MKTPQPFSCTFTPHIPELLNQLNCSLVLSTYQAGKLVFISPKDNERLIQLPRTFPKPMGIGIHPVDQNKIAVACQDEVIVFKNSSTLAAHYPKAPQQYDALYLPRVSYKTNFLDIHDLEFGKDGIYAVNTLFSCLMKLSEDFSFEPIWQPQFISQLVSEDRCHLNGMLMKDGLPKYVTTFNQGDQKQSWRKNVTKGGCLIDVDNQTIITNQLSMPHSPKWINNKIYCLESAKGRLVEIDQESGTITEIVRLDAFVRGMDQIGDYLLIGMSKLRENSSSFHQLIPHIKNNRAGVAFIHLPTKSYQGEITYQSSVDEIYDVKVMHNCLRPNILHPNHPESKMAVDTPEQSYWQRPTNAV